MYPGVLFALSDPGRVLAVEVPSNQAVINLNSIYFSLLWSLSLSNCDTSCIQHHNPYNKNTERLTPGISL